MLLQRVAESVCAGLLLLTQDAYLHKSIILYLHNFRPLSLWDSISLSL